MRRMKPNHLLWGAIAVAFLLLAGCSTTAYKQYMAARDAYDQCLKRSESSGERCVSERENLDGTLSRYEREAERNYWWRNAVENEREKDPLYHFDRKPQ